MGGFKFKPRFSMRTATPRFTGFGCRPNRRLCKFSYFPFEEICVVHPNTTSVSKSLPYVASCTVTTVPVVEAPGRTYVYPLQVGTGTHMSY